MPLNIIMPMDRFLTLKYYFTPLPDPNFQYTKITLALGLILLVAGFLAGYTRRRILKDEIARKILKPYPGKLKLYGLLVLVLLMVREQGIPYLSMRLFWFLLLGFFLYTFIRLAFTYKKQHALRQQRLKKNAKQDQYIPRKKR